MTDEHSRAYGLAHSAIIVELFKLLLKNGQLIPKDVQALLTNAGKTLGAQGTDVAAAATEHVKMIGEAVGAAR